MDAVTHDELSMYVTIDDFIRCNETIALGTPDVCNSGGVGGAVGARLEKMEREIGLIKDALLDIQDTLRQLGLDDMSQRLGDLNLLLT